MKHVKKIFSTTGEPMLSARSAALRLDCAQDYIGKLCREGKLEGKQVGGAWFVDEASLKLFESTRVEAKTVRSQELSALRRQEQKAHEYASRGFFGQTFLKVQEYFPKADIRRSAHALLVSALIGGIVFGGNALLTRGAYQNTSLSAALGQIQSPFFGTGTQMVFGSAGSALANFFAGLFGGKDARVAGTPSPAVAVPQFPESTSTSTSASASATSPQAPKNKSGAVVQNTYPIRERVVERIVTQSGVTQELLSAQLQQLSNSLRSELYGSINGLSSVPPAQGGIGGAIAISQNISKLSGVTITNSTISGYLPTSGGTVESIDISGSATSTFAGGIAVTGGCVSVEGTCLGTGGGGAGNPGGSDTQVQFNDGGSFNGNSAFTFATTSARLTVTFASTTALSSSYASSTSLYAGTLSLGSALGISYGGTGTSTAPSYGQLLVGNVAGGYDLLATSSLGITGFSTSSVDYWKTQNDFFSTTSATFFSAAGLAFSTTSANYWSSINNLTGFSTTSAIYFVNASTTIPKTYTSNIFTAPQTINFASSTALTVSGTAYIGTASTSNLTVSLLPATLLSTNGSGVAQTTTVSAPLSFSGSTLSITQSGTASDGYLSSADYSIFNNKISSTSLSATFPIAYNSSTGAFTFGGLSTSTTAVVGNIPYFSGTNTFANVATSTPTISAPLAYSGTLGSFVGGAGGAFSIAQSSIATDGYLSSADYTVFNKKISSSSLSQIFPFTPTTNYGAAANSTSTPIWFSAGLQASSTSHFAAIDLATPLAISSGGVGTSTAPAYGQLLVGNGLGAYSFVATSSLNISATDIATGTLAVTHGGTGVSSITGIVVGIGTAAFSSVTDSLGFANVITDETGTGLLVYNTSPSFAGKASFANASSSQLSVFDKAYFGGTATSSFDSAGVLTLASALGVSSGGTGISSVTAAGVLLGNYAGTGYQHLATSSLGLLTTNVAEGSRLYYTDERVGTYIGAIDKGYFFATTSADYWKLSNNFFSTTSATFFSAAGLAFSTTSSNYFINSSTTIIKAYGNNTWTGGNIFTASTTIGDGTQGGGLTVSGGATTTGTAYFAGSVGIATNNPSKTLDVSGTGRFDSTLTLSGSASCTGSQALQTNSQGDISCGSINVSGASSGGGWTTNNIGSITLSTTTDRVAVGATSTPYAKLVVISSNSATTTLALLPASGATANILDIYNTSGALASVLTAGHLLGLGTTSPSQALSVQGNALFSGNLFVANLTATGTLTIAGAITSTASTANILPYASSTALTVSGTAYFGTASTTALNVSGTATLQALSSQLLSTGASGAIQSTTVSTPLDFSSNTLSLNIGAGLTTNAGNLILNLNSANSWLALQQFSAGASTTALSVYNSLFVGGTATTTIRGDGTASTIPFASSTALTVSGTGYFGNVSVTGSSTLQNFTFGNATGTSATTTSFFATGMSATNLVATGATTTALFSTTASSTNLFSANATLGSTTLDKLAVSGNAQINGALTLTGSLSCTGQQALQTNTNGDVSCQTVNLTGITSAGGWSTNNFGTVKLATSTDAVVVGATTTLPYAKLSVAGDHTGSTTLALIPVLSQTANIIDLYNTSGVLSSVLTAGHLLGLGTATPTYKLDVAGLGRFTGLVDAANFVATSTTATSTFAGSVGIGTTSPSKKFSVNGDALFSGTITSSGLIITGAITSSANSATVLPYASSTALTVSGTAYIGTASTSNLTVSNLPATLLSTNGSGVAQSTTVSAPLAFSGSTLSITQSGIATDGYLSSADYTVFNNKISSSSLSQIFPFTPTTNYGAAANSTSTALWFQNGLQASSTSRFVDALFNSATTTSFAVTGSTTVNTLNLTNVLTVANGGTGLTTAPSYGQLLLGNASSGYTLVATSSLGITAADITGILPVTHGGTGIGSLTGILVGNGTSAFTTLTDSLGLINNISDETGTSTLVFSGSPTFSGTASFNIASTSRLTVSLLPATLLSTNGSGVAQSTTVSAPLAFSGSTLSITQSGTGADGYLSSADYSIFNNKISSSSLSQIFPFTPTTNYGAAANSTSTALWFQNGLQASSTSHFVYASTTALTVSGNFYGAGLSTCSSSVDKILWTNGGFSCGVDAGASGTEFNWAFFNGSGIRLGTTTNQVLIGATATSSLDYPLVKLGVIGGAFIDHATTTSFFATTASTTNLSVGSNAIVYGNLGLGSSSPSARLSIFGGNIIQQATGTPLFVATTTTTDHTYASVASGRYIYIADNLSGLRIYDNSNPKQMTLVGTYSAVSGVVSVAVAGKYAYIGDTAAGLVIVDVSNPAVPTLVGTYAGGDAYGIALSGKYAFTSNYTSGKVNVIDVSDPTAPRLASSTYVGGNPYGIAVQGKYLYVANQANGKMQIVDISNPAAPAIAGTYTGGTNPTGIYVSGKYAYVADAGEGLLIINISNSASPTLTGSYEPTAAYYGVSVAGNYAYVADHVGKVKVIDISNPASPQGAGTYTFAAGLPLGIMVSGKYAYVANDDNGLAVIDINGIESPAAHIGTLAANTADISDNLTVGNNIYAGGGLNVGISGIFSRGTISAFIASTTATNPTVANFMGGNVGIGTTSPYRQLSVGNSGIFGGDVLAAYFTATSTTVASSFAGGLTSYASSTIGNGTQAGGLTISGGATTTGNHLVSGTFAATGNATFAGTLTVNSLCVAADTKLRRRRRNSKTWTRGVQVLGDDEYVYDEVRIDEVEAGDEIQSLDEKTGRLVWSRVKQLAYMGVRQTYRITTEDGRTIRTTDNHPYLTRLGWRKVKYLEIGQEIAVSQNENAALADGARSTPRVAERYEEETDTSTSIANRLLVSSWQNSPVYKAVEGLEPSRSGMSVPSSHRATAYFGFYHKNESAINSGVAWSKIVSIEPVAEEDVYDIEVEGTHNFIGNGIVAHNTAVFNGGLTTTGATSTGTFAVTASTTLASILNVGGSLNANGALTVLGNTSLQGATSTTFAITGIASGNILKTTTDGSIIAAVAGTDYVTGATLTSAYPFALTGNATSTLTQFNGGLTSYASSTIGNGTQAGGLTISGGATTTGNAAFTATTGTTTIASGQGFTIGSSQFVLQQGSGNVGIGTQSPVNNKLEVVVSDTDTGIGQSYGQHVLGIRNSNTTANNIASIAFYGSNDYQGNVQIGVVYKSHTLGAKSGDIFFATNNSGTFGEKMRITAAGNVGIGTTTPWGKLSVTGAGTGTGVNFLLANSANTPIFKVLDDGSITATGAFTSTATGANTFPYASSTALTVSGHCVTGDSRLTYRRRKKKGEHADSEEGEWEDSDYIYGSLRVDDVQGGEEIASLDEKTGEIVFSRVNALMDMGVKDVFELETADGKTIRTTAEHPYLVKNARGKWLRHESPIEKAGWATVANLREGDEIAVLSNNGISRTGVHDREVSLHQRNDVIESRFDMFASQIGKSFQKLINSSSVAKRPEKLPQHNSMAVEGGYAVAYLGVNNDIFVNDNALLGFHSANSVAQNVNVAWELNYLSRAVITSFSNSIKRPLYFFGIGNWASNTSILSRWCSNVAGYTRNTTRPGVRFSGNLTMSKKSVSLERMMRDSLSDLAYTSSSESPTGERVASCPSAFSTFTNLFLKFSSHKNFTVRRGGEAGNALSLGAARGEIKSGTDVLLADGRPVFENLVDSLSMGQRFEHLPDHNSSSGERELAPADLRVGDDVFVDGDALIHNATSIAPERMKPQWSRIVAIRRLPAEQVWDLEIAGTHNFVANGIVAHNTYLGNLLASASSTIGDGTQAGGLTISGGATTTLNAYFGSKVGILNQAPTYALDVAGFINTDQYSGYKQAGNTILVGSTTLTSLFVGYQAGNSTAVTGSNNNAMGYQALQNITSGTRNTANGTYAVNADSTADDNTGLGYATLYVTTGTGNTGVGSQALFNNTTGTNNVAVGLSAMAGNKTGSGNFGLGYGSLYYATSTSNQIAIGTNALAGTNGQYINGTGNNAIGYGALQQNYAGSSNNTFGFITLQSNTTGSDNNAFGYQALNSNTTGSSNIGIGTNALGNNTSATSSVAIGYDTGRGAGGYYSNQGSALLGYQSGYNFATGSDYNTLLGYQTGYNVTTGAHNTILGYSGTTGGITTGSDNILIGDDVRNGLTVTSSNQLNIGNLLFSNSVGTGATAATGNIGVGTSTPWGKLSVTQTGTAGEPAFIVEDSASPDTTPFIIDQTGNVGIGTTTPVSTLSVQGSLCVRNTGSCGTTAGTIYASTATVEGIDLAEQYPTSDQSLAPGEIVSLDGAGGSYIKRAVRGETPLGIISTAPGLTLGLDVAGGKPVALSGRVPLLVNNEGGSIKVGDHIMLSSVAGVGMAATTSAQTVGVALDSADFATSTAATINVFVQPEFTLIQTDRSLLAALGEIASSTINGSQTSVQALSATASDFMAGLFARITGWLADSGNGILDLFATRIHAETVYAKELCLGDTCIDEQQLKALLNGSLTSVNTSTSTNMGTSGVQGTSDVQAPTVTLNGNNPASVAVGAVYSDLGAIITDNVDTNIGYTVSLDNATSTDLSNLVLDTSVGGTHYIVFTAADQAGNTGTATRTVIVGDGATIATSTTPLDTQSDLTGQASTIDTTSTMDTATSTPIITPIVTDAATSTATSTTP